MARMHGMSGKNRVGLDEPSCYVRSFHGCVSSTSLLSSTYFALLTTLFLLGLGIFLWPSSWSSFFTHAHSILPISARIPLPLPSSLPLLLGRPVQSFDILSAMASR